MHSSNVLPHRRSVRTRLMLWNACILALLLAFLGGIIQFTMQAVLLQSVDQDLANRVKPFTDRPRRHGPGPPPPYPGPPPDGGQPPHRGTGRFAGSMPPDMRLPPPRWPAGERPPTHALSPREIQDRAQTAYWPRELTPEGRTSFPVEGQPPWDSAAFEIAARGTEWYSTVTVNDERVRILSEPLFDHGRLTGVLQMPYPLGDIDRAISGMRSTLVTLVPAALLLAGLGAAVVTGRVLRPVRQIVAAAEQIGAHDLSQRLEVTGNDEFSQLATTFNDMLGRLDDAFSRQQSLVRQLEALLAQQQRFVADASHELKTPLAVAKVHIGLFRQTSLSDVEMRESVEDIDHALDRMNRLVQDLLLLARYDAGQLGRRATDLLVRDVLEQARRNTAVPEGPTVHVDVEDPCLTVFGNESEIVRVFSNLLENAIRHTPPDGEICARSETQGDSVRVAVTDTGSGIAPEHLPHLGERFYRVDAARARPDGGAGLGLSICKSIVEEHGGTTEFESALGKGTTVRVTLPRGRTEA